MPHANLAEADRPERAKACAHGHDGHVRDHSDEKADGHGHPESCGHGHEAGAREDAHEHGESCGHGREAHDPDQAHDHDAQAHEHGESCSHGGAANELNHDHAHARSHAEASCCGTAHAAAPPVKLPQSEAVGSDLRTAIRIMQMDCPTEEALIRKKFSRMPSVRSMDFNLMQRVLTVVHAPDALETILAAIRSLDFTPELADANPDAAAAAPQAPSKPWWPLALAGIAAVGSEAAGWLGAPVWLAAGLALLAIASCGLTTYKKGWVAIRNGNLNINALMSIAVTGALILRQWPEAAMVMVLFTIAELIEAKSLDRARNAIQGLMQLTPEQASVQQADGSWRLMDLKAIALGAVVRVKPGERIALDGEIVAGRSSVDQAPITGESLPVDKTVGDAVFAGTINQAGSFDYRVTAAASNTTLARIIHAVEEAQGTKAPTQRFVDQFARVYTPIVFAARARRGGAAAAAVRRTVARMDLQGAGDAGDRLPVRAGDLDAGDDRQRPRRGRAQRHPDQRRRLSRTGPQAEPARARQDRHDHARQAGANRVRDTGRRRRRSLPDARGESCGPLGSSGVDGDRGSGEKRRHR